MKSGASDPFADESSDEVEHGEPDHDENADQQDVSEAASDTSTAETESSAIIDGESSASRSPTDASNTGPQESSGQQETNRLSRSELPFVLRRDRVKDERPEVHQLFVQQDTHDEAISAERQLQDRLDDDLARTDAREAIYRAGMKHLDDAEDLLRTWGYDL